MIRLRVIRRANLVFLFTGVLCLLASTQTFAKPDLTAAVKWRALGDAIRVSEAAIYHELFGEKGELRSEGVLSSDRFSFLIPGTMLSDIQFVEEDDALTVTFIFRKTSVVDPSRPAPIKVKLVKDGKGSPTRFDLGRSGIFARENTAKAVAKILMDVEDTRLVENKPSDSGSTALYIRTIPQKKPLEMVWSIADFGVQAVRAIANAIEKDGFNIQPPKDLGTERFSVDRNRGSKKIYANEFPMNSSNPETSIDIYPATLTLRINRGATVFVEMPAYESKTGTYLPLANLHGVRILDSKKREIIPKSSCPQEFRSQRVEPRVEDFG